MNETMSSTGDSKGVEINHEASPINSPERKVEQDSRILNSESSQLSLNTKESGKTAEEFYTYKQQDKVSVGSLVEIKDITVEKDYYGLFLRSLISIMCAGVGGDKPYGDLGIYKVHATFPQGKWQDHHTNISKGEASASKTPEFKEDDTTKKVNIIQIQLDREVVSKLNSDNRKVKSGEILSFNLQEALTKMAKLFYLFFRRDGSTGGQETSEAWTYDVSEFYKAQMTLTKEKIGNLTYHVLTFIRVHEGRYYKCSVYFQGEGFTSQIRSHYIYYADKAGNKGGYYQANGSYASARSHVGGIETKVKSDGHEGTEIDAQLSSMGDNFETQPWNAGKGIYILGRGGYHEEVRKTFNATQYWYIKQKPVSISRENAGKREYYKKIHPLAELFYKTTEELTTVRFHYTTPIEGLTETIDQKEQLERGWRDRIGLDKLKKS